MVHVFFLRAAAVDAAKMLMAVLALTASVQSILAAVPAMPWRTVALPGRLGTAALKTDDYELVSQLDLRQQGLKFEGVGALSGGGGTSRYLYDYPEDTQEAILDALFNKTAGGALQMLKIEIGGDTWSTQATEPSHMHSRGDLNCSRGYEWKIAVAARRRNPSISIYGLSWGVPGWIGNGSFFSQDNIEYQTAWLRCMRDTHSLEVDWLGIWNEQKLPTATYIGRLRAHLDANGFRRVGIVAGDNTGWKIVDNVLANPVFLSGVARISSHYPMVMGGFLPASKRQQLAAVASKANRTMPLWASEDWSLGEVADWAGALQLGATINRNAVEGGITCTIIWNLMFAWNYLFGYSRAPQSHKPPFGGAGHGLLYAAEPWSEHWALRPALFAVMHTTQFSTVGDELPPNAMGLLPQGLGTHCTYYRNDSAFSLVIETANATGDQVAANKSVSIRFLVQFRGTDGATRLRCWQSVENDLFRELAEVPITRGHEFTLHLLPAALYSCSTYMIGSAPIRPSSPHSSPFPFPYADNFEQYSERSMVRYLTAEGGVFETAETPRGSLMKGKIVLKQVVKQKPIPWYSDPLPFATLGDPSPIHWQNYSVSVATFIPSSAAPSTPVAAPTVVMDKCNGRETQSWKWRPLSVIGMAHGRNMTVGQWTTLGKCLGRSGKSLSAAGVSAPTIGLVVCDSTDPTQQWQTVNESTVAGHLTYQLITPSASGRCLDVWGPHSTPGTPTDLWPCYSPARINQQWYTEKLESGALCLRSAFDDQCLTASPNPTSPTSAAVPFTMVCGRISSYDSCHRGASLCPPPHGYCLHLLHSGDWKLLFANALLAAGSLSGSSLSTPVSHHLQVQFEGSKLHAMIDNVLITPSEGISASNSTGGMIAIGSGFHTAFFDDLNISHHDLRRDSPILSVKV